MKTPKKIKAEERFWTGWCIVGNAEPRLLISPMFNSAKAARKHWTDKGGSLEVVKALKVKICLV